MLRPHSSQVRREKEMEREECASVFKHQQYVPHIGVGLYGRHSNSLKSQDQSSWSGVKISYDNMGYNMMRRLVVKEK